MWIRTLDEMNRCSYCPRRRPRKHLRRSDRLLYCRQVRQFPKTVAVKISPREALCRADSEAAVGMMVLRRGYQCAELIIVMMVPVEGGLEWGYRGGCEN